MKNYDDRIYYEDQTDWTTVDRYALWRYLDRLVGYIGPTPAEREDPTSYSARIAAKRAGVRDEEIRALDLSRMSEDTRYLLKHLLIRTGRYDTALERFENLRGLDDVGRLDHEIRLSEHPRHLDRYLTEVGIHL